MLHKNKPIIFYCSIQAVGTPPYYFYKLAQSLSSVAKVIFIELPTQNYLTKKKFFPSFLIQILNFLFNSNFLIWKFFSKIQLELYLLKIFIFINKSFGKKIIIITSSGFDDHIYSLIKKDYFIFDCIDRFENEFENYQQIKKFDLILANTQLIHNNLKKINPHIKKISCGYCNSQINSFTKKPRRLIKNSVVFYGGISRRLTYDPLIKAVKQLKDIDFYFIGGMYLNKHYSSEEDNLYLKKWKQLLNLDNTNYLGYMDINSAEKILPFFCLGIIPYIFNDCFNYHAHPMKIYNYLKAGLPIISTNIPAVNQYTQKYDIYIYQTENEFINLIKTIVTKRNNKQLIIDENKISKLIKRESTQTKTNQIINLISKNT